MCHLNAGLEKNLRSGYPSEKQLSNVAFPGLVLFIFFFWVVDNLPGTLQIGQVRMKSSLPSRKNLLVLVGMTGWHIFSALYLATPSVLNMQGFACFCYFCCPESMRDTAAQ